MSSKSAPTNPPQYSIEELIKKHAHYGHGGIGEQKCTSFDAQELEMFEKELNQLIYTQVLELIGKKRLPAYRQGRVLPPNQVGAENTDPEHVKMWKAYNAGYNLKVEQLRAKAKERFNG
jgi:hypothetical protein